jgi:hypothetical protein
VPISPEGGWSVVAESDVAAAADEVSAVPVVVLQPAAMLSMRATAQTTAAIFLNHFMM